MPLFRKPAIGLDISDNSIEAVLIVKKGGRLTLKSYGRTVLQKGLVVDGTVARKNELGVAVRKLLADQMTPPLPKGLNRVIFALPDSQVFSHIFEVPSVAEESELGRSLALEADGHFPFNHEELVARYAVIAQKPDKNEIYYAAAPKDVLKGWLALFSVAKLEPAVIENESTSTARSILESGETDPVMIVDIGARVTDISIFDLRGIQFSETLETAGDAFDAALARVMDITLDDAESLKRSQGLMGDVDIRAQKALLAEVEKLVAGIRAAVEYYENRSHRLVARVVLCGGSSLVPGLSEYVASHLPPVGRTLRVEAADPWTDLEVSPVLEKLGVRGRGVLIATAIGLGLRGAGVRKFAEIDFLPAGVKPEKNLGMGPSGGASKRGLPAWLKAVIVTAAVMFLAAAVWSSIFILPGFFKKSGAKPVSPPAGPVGVETVTEVQATLGDFFSLEQSVLKRVDIEVEADSQKDFTHSATRTEGFSSGKIELINGSAKAQTLVGKTRLLSESGVLFRLSDRVTIPAHGRTAASITADVQGAQGDVPAGRFTIPGLSKALQTVIYGLSTEPTSGGEILVGPPYTQKELDDAKAAFSSQAEAGLFDAAVKKAGKDYVVLRGLFSVTGVEIVVGPEVGQVTGDFTMKARVKGAAAAFSPDEAGKILAAELEKEAGGKAVTAPAVQDLTYEVKSFDPKAGTGTVLIRSSVAR